ncbi:melanoma inhibitory activity protein 2 [Scomber japonicus]|uniref:melanoma inhibitory activity protein 2 n=1 Tax=Scomber japonicus TaxID=13676 RepID=UPI00230688F1|nr:melanoma inhibitory activity protein 2 [Scomber japonicus]
MLDSSSQTGSEEEEEILDDNANETDVAGEVKKKEMEGEDHQVSESVGNEDEVNSKEPGEEIQTAIDLDQDFVPQNDISSGSVFSSDDLKSAGQSVSEAQEVKSDDKIESVKEEEAEVVRQQIDNTEESNEMSLETGASSDDHKAEGSSKETDVLHQEIPTTLSDESTEHSRVSGGAEESSGENLPSLSPDTAEEKNEPEPIQDDSLTTDHLDTPAITDNNTEAETHHDALGQEFDSSHTTDVSAEMHEQALEEDTGTFSSHESTTNQDTSMDNIHLSSVSPPMQTMATKSEGDSDKLKEMENNLQPAEAEKEMLDSEKDFMKEHDQKSEREVETEEEPKGEEERLKIEELKEGETQEELKEVEEIKEEEKMHELKENEKQEGIEELKEEEKKVEDLEKEKQEEIEELKEEVKLEELKKVEEMKKEEKQEGLKEVEEMKKEEKQEELKEVEEMKKEEKQEELKKMEEMKKEEKQEIAEELKQEAVDELKRDEKQHEVEELKKDEKQEGVEELKGVTKQEEVGGLSEGVKQQKVEEIKEEKKKEVVEEELKEDEKKEEVEEKNQEQVEELKEEVKPVEELRKEEKQQNVEEVMEEKKEEVMESKEEDKQEQVEELREDEKQHNVEEEKKDKVVEELKKEEKQEELKEKEMHDQNDTGNEKETQYSESVFSETAEKTEQSPTESFQAEEEKRDAELQIEEKQEAVEEIKEEERREVDVKQQAEDVEEETRSKEEDSGQILSTRTEESERISFKREEDRIQEEEQMKHEMEEKRKDNDKADVKEKEQEEVDQKGEIEQTDNEVPHSIPNESLDHLAGDSSTTEKIPEIHSEDHNGGVAEDESGGAFGLFKNAFGLFGETPGAEIKESTEPTPSLDTNTGETSQPEASLTPEQDSTIASSQVYTEDTTIQPSSPSLTQTPSHPSSPSPNTEAPLKPKTHSKHYKTLLVHMSADDMAILEELFGRHKLQFLDFILGGSEVVTKDPESESILFDIETLLNHHVEMLTDAPQEDKEKTRTLIALQKLQMLLERVRQAFNTGDESRKTGDSSISLHDNIRRDEGMKEKKERDGEMSGGTGKKKESEKRGGKEARMSTEETGDEASQLGSLQQLGEVMKQILDFAHQTVEDSSTHARAVAELLIWLSVQVVSSLPDDIRPGPDLYGVPWEPVIFSSLVGLLTMLLFSCRCYSSVKSRLYRSKERWMAEQFSQLLDEKCKVLETLSKCQQEYDELETSLRDSGVLAQTQKTEHLEVKATQLEHAKRELERDLDQLKDQLDQQKEHRIEQEKRIAALEESMKTCEEEAKNLQSLEEQAQTTLKVYSMNSDRLQRNLETAGEENALLQESNAQLQQQVEGWAERVSELEEEMRRCEAAHNGMMQDVANKDERIMSLTDRLLRMKAWDSDLEEERGEEGGEETSNGTAEKGEENGKGDDSQSHLQKVQKLIYAAKLNADLKSVDEDKDRVFAKLNDEVKAKEELEGSIKELEDEQLSLQSDSEHYTDQVQRLQQKLNIMTEMYQENELKLHRLLTVEEKERLQKEEKLNKADKNIALAMEELQNYRRRAEEMEEELEKTKQSYQTQISAHEKKAHNNWLAARAADRELSDIRRENALFRQKLTDTQFKLDALDKDPYALDSLARPLPFRAERSPYGPSPLGRPASETRAFLSPPTLMEGPPARLSPRVEPPGGQGEMERSGGPHSDSGSISPTWERDRRGHMPGPPGPLGPPGYMFPEPGGPMYRRPVPPPGAMGILPPPGSLPLGPPLPHPRGHPLGGPPSRPHPADMADGPYRENSLGPGEQDPRESGPSDRRTPPEADPRMGGAPPPGPPMGPMDGPFPRRAPYGPPDFYPPRGPGGPPMMPMWAPPPPGMMFPPRFPPGGPPHPHMPSYGPPMRAPPPDGLPPPSMGPPPTQSQSPEEHAPSPQDMI